METDQLLPPEGFEGVTLECVGERSVDDLRLEHFGARLGYSRATMYRVYGNRRGLLTQLHDEVMERLDTRFFACVGDRREQFEWWWLKALAALRSHQGQLFLRLRPVVAPDEGIEALVRIEVRGLRRLGAWVREHCAPEAVQDVAELAWTLLLSAAAVEEERSAERLRELVWGVIVAAAPKVEDIAPKGAGKLPGGRETIVSK